MLTKELDQSVISIDTFSKQGGARQFVLHGEGIITFTTNTVIRSRIEGVLRTNLWEDIIKSVSFRVTDIFRGRDNDFMVMGQDLFIEPPGHKFHAIHPFYVRKMTGLTDDEEKFLRLYRLGHAKSSQDKLRYNMIIEKIQHYQMAKKSDFEAIRNHREGSGGSVDLF